MRIPKGSDREFLLLNKNILQRIAARRRELGYTVEHMGNALGLSRNGYSLKERGQRPFRKYEMQLVLENLQLSIEEIMGFSSMKLDSYSKEVVLWIESEEGCKMINELYQRHIAEQNKNK